MFDDFLTESPEPRRQWRRIKSLGSVRRDAGTGAQANTPRRACLRSRFRDAGGSRRVPLVMTEVNREDWELMQAVSEGDEAAAGILYDRFGALVFRSARQVLPTRAEAEDAVQEIFVQLWKTAIRYDPERAKLVTWVMVITRRHLIDRLRRKRVRPLDLSLEGEPAGREASASEEPGRLEKTERNQLLLSRIEELPVMQREVIERAYLQGFTLREVAEQLDAPLGTVKSALSRGLARLRDRLADDPRVREGLG